MRSGRVSTTAARQVDEGTSPINAIVSVLMLREGWDVQNVTVIVGLRPYTARANILPEQTIGRGLRLMFADRSTTYVERVDVVGNAAFLKFVEQLERDEEIALDTFDLKEPLVITTVVVDPEKLDRDITVPVLTPILARKKTLAEEIAGLDVAAMECPVLPRNKGDTAAQQFHYEGVDIVTLQKLVERDYTIPEPQTADESSRTTRSALRKMSSCRPSSPPWFRRSAGSWSSRRSASASTSTIGPSSRRWQQRGSVRHGQDLCQCAARTGDRGVDALPGGSRTQTLRYRTLSVSPARRSQRRRLCSRSSPLTTSSSAPSLSSWKTHQMFAPSPSSQDASAFRSSTPTALPTSVTTSPTSSRWTARVPFLIEPKGREDVDVTHKDRAARIWCENATLLTNVAWQYVKVPQVEWNKLQPDDLAEVLLTFGSAP